jgi:hypothetical protein
MSSLTPSTKLKRSRRSQSRPQNWMCHITMHVMILSHVPMKHMGEASRSLLPLLSTTTVSVLTLPSPFTLPRCFRFARPFSALSCAAASTCTKCSQPRLSLLGLMMLCSLCSSIDFEGGAHAYEPGSTNFPKHHSSFTDLETSANSGCQLFQTLFHSGASPMKSGGRAHRGGGVTYIKSIIKHTLVLSLRSARQVEELQRFSSS